MFRNYFKIAIRNLVKNKLHASINILGLAMGFVVAILSILYIHNELNYDRWLPENERIYRTYRQYRTSDGGWTYTPKRLANFLLTEVAGVEKATAVFESDRILLTKGENTLYVQKFANVDSLYFEVFQFPFLYGNAETAMDKPNSIVLSERLAELFFGKIDPIGQLIKGDGETDYIVTGVLKDIGENSYLDYEVYTPFFQTWMDAWLANNVATYILKDKLANLEQVEERTNEALFPIYKREMNANNMPVETRQDLPNWQFQPLSDIHLASKNIAGVRASSGDLDKLYLFGVIAFIVLLIAAINYLNLATAKAATRAKEVGMRKVSGAQKSQLVIQFLTESTLQSLFALAIALVLSEFLLPIFNQITDRELTFIGGDFSWVLLPMLGIGLVIGVLAGLYPAFFLSSFQPVKVLKGKVLKTTSGRSFRQGLVITQFTMTVVLMIVLAFVYKQISYMQSQDLGFSGEQVLSVEVNRWETSRSLLDDLSRLTAIPGVESVALSNNIPGYQNGNYTTHMQGIEGNQNPGMLFVTPEYLETMGLEMAEGRFFSYDYATDTTNAFVVNETFLKKYSIEAPLNKRINFVFENEFAPIIGVVKDHHFTSLQEKIGPMVMTARRNMGYFTYASFRLSSKNMPATIAAIESVWREIEPTHPIQYSFIDETFNRQYQENERFGRTILYATILAVFIAMLGLFGLASFMAEQRTKEIGVRKVLGASTTSLIQLLLKDFVKLVCIAGIIAVPFGYYFVKKWLEDFAYTTEINALPFIIAIMGSVILAVFTVAYQSLKVSLENPVDALKTE